MNDPPQRMRPEDYDPDRTCEVPFAVEEDGRRAPRRQPSREPAINWPAMAALLLAIGFTVAVSGPIHYVAGTLSGWIDSLFFDPEPGPPAEGSQRRIVVDPATGKRYEVEPNGDVYEIN